MKHLVGGETVLISHGFLGGLRGPAADGLKRSRTLWVLSVH